MTVRAGVGMQWRRARGLVLAAALGAVVLTACDSEDGEDPQDAAVVENQDQDGDGVPDADGDRQTVEAVPPPTEPAEITPVPPERSVSVEGNTIEVSGDRAAFVLPSGNIACVLTEETAVCQIHEKNYEPRADFMVADVAGDCSVADADAMTLRAESEAWLCVGQDLRPSAGVEQGGWWEPEIDGDTLDVDGSRVAVLPYGQTMQVGPVSCRSDQQGVICRQPELQRREIVLGSSTYWLRRF